MLFIALDWLYPLSLYLCSSSHRPLLFECFTAFMCTCLISNLCVSFLIMQLDASLTPCPFKASAKEPKHDKKVFKVLK